MAHKFLSWIQAFFYAHVTIYWRAWKFSRIIDIRNADETLDYILNHRVSISRFGDGEIDVIAGRGNGMQTPNRELGEQLKRVILSNTNNHIICLPYGWKSTRELRKSNKMMWTWFVANNYKLLINILNKNRIYYNASYTRFYMDILDKHSESMKYYVDRFRLQWQDRDVLMVEGESTRFGVDNDFLANARSIHRILCPSKNAFDKYDEILSTVLNNSNNNTLILCALGMTATVLTYDLAREGREALDIGHADIEYEWYKKGVDKKVPIEGKNVNELGILNPEAPRDKKYESEIIAKVL